jgi:hypothetical protein
MMSERYPGYDVLAKRHSPSWNDQTRAVIDERLAIDPAGHRFFTDAEWPTMLAVCARIIPQPAARAKPVPIAALIDAKLFGHHGDGYRDARLPPQGEAWRRGLAALEAESQHQYRVHFHELRPLSQDDLLKSVQQGKVSSPTWGDMSASVFFAKRLLHDIVSVYYAHPTSWNEIGFGGPAAPRGYVRMGFDRRDPWEAAEAHPGHEEQARRENARVG